MEGLELISFQIISTVGTARSCYIEAIKASRLGNFDEADRLVQEDLDAFVEGHRVHAELLQAEAKGEPVEMSLLLMHAEDQLMSAESFKILAEEFIGINRLIHQKQ